MQQTADKFVSGNSMNKTAEKFASNRSGSRGRQTAPADGSGRISIRQSSSIASNDSKGGTKKEAFFSKHKDSIDASVSSKSKKRDSS